MVDVKDGKKDGKVVDFLDFLNQDILSESVRVERSFILGFAKGRGWPLTVKAVTYAHKWHAGQKRRDGSDYIDHPITVCRMLVNLGSPLVTDVIAATAILHDVEEECHVSTEVIGQEFGMEVACLVDNVSRRKDEALEDFYQRVFSDPRSILIKGYDRITNIGNMAKMIENNQEVDRLERYIDDTETYVIKILKAGRRIYDEYSDLFVTCRDHLRSIIDIAKPYAREMRRRQEVEKRMIELEGMIAGYDKVDHKDNT